MFALAGWVGFGRRRFRLPLNQQLNASWDSSKRAGELKSQVRGVRDFGFNFGFPIIKFRNFVPFVLAA